MCYVKLAICQILCVMEGLGKCIHEVTLYLYIGYLRENHVFLGTIRKIIGQTAFFSLG